jgi:hypothetical protein
MQCTAGADAKAGRRGKLRLALYVCANSHVCAKLSCSGAASLQAVICDSSFCFSGSAPPPLPSPPLPFPLRYVCVCVCVSVCVGRPTHRVNSSFQSGSASSFRKSHSTSMTRWQLSSTAGTEVLAFSSASLLGGTTCTAPPHRAAPRAMHRIVAPSASGSDSHNASSTIAQVRQQAAG